MDELGIVTTAVDPDDPGRTVVRPIPRHGAAPPVDEQLATAAGTQDRGQAKDLISTLEALARRLAGTLSPELFDWYAAETPSGAGPPRVGQDEIRSSFADGWRVDAIEAATSEQDHIVDGAPAWLATITRI